MSPCSTTQTPYSLEISSLALEEMQELRCGWYQREGKIFTIQNESIDQILLCSACEVHMLISFSVWSGIAKQDYNSLWLDSVHVATQAVTSFSLWRQLMSNIFRTDKLHTLDKQWPADWMLLFPYSNPSPPIPYPKGLKSLDLNSKITVAWRVTRFIGSVVPILISLFSPLGDFNFTLQQVVM